MKPGNSILVKGRFNGFRLDQFLLETSFLIVPLIANRKSIQDLVQRGAIRVNGNIVRPSYRVKPGEMITLTDDPVRSSREDIGPPIMIPAIPILYEDESIVAINKPAGLSMHPSKPDQKGTLVDWINENQREILDIGEDPLRPGIVHRLDKETSGIVVLAKNNRAFVALKKLFHERKVQKSYIALVYGSLKKKQGVISAPVGRIEGSVRRGTPLSKRSFSGKIRESETEYELSTNYPHYSLLSVKPKTGRTHQIRVHLASIGHPVVGDRLYRFKQHRRDDLDPPHQLLHAEKIHFILFGKEYSIECPLPSYFTQALTSLKSHQ